MYMYIKVLLRTHYSHYVHAMATTHKTATAVSQDIKATINHSTARVVINGNIFSY